MKNYDIRLFIPDDVKSLKNCNELLVDREGLDILKDYLDINSLNYYLISDDASIYRFVVRVFGVENVKVLQVGVDIGRRLAYVVLCDSLLLKAGYALSPKDLIEDLRRLREFLTPSETVVKVGSSIVNGGLKVNYLMRELLTSGFEVMVIDENSSSSKMWNILSGYKTRFTTDIHAALNIAFREGIRVSKAFPHP